MSGIGYKTVLLMAIVFSLGFCSGCSSAEFVFLGVIKKNYFRKPDVETAIGLREQPRTIKRMGYYNVNSIDSSGISGTVLTQEGVPIPFAQVSFKKSDADQFTPWTTFEADDKANFLIENLENGSYMLACIYPQYNVKVITGVHVSKVEKKVGFLVVLDPTFK
jgi:hypothetical protein